MPFMTMSDGFEPQWPVTLCIVFRLHKLAHNLTILLSRTSKRTAAQSDSHDHRITRQSGSAAVEQA